MCFHSITAEYNGPLGVAHARSDDDRYDVCCWPLWLLVLVLASAIFICNRNFKVRLVGPQEATLSTLSDTISNEHVLQ